jgi:hypothetical protein
LAYAFLIFVVTVINSIFFNRSWYKWGILLSVLLIIFVRKQNPEAKTIVYGIVGICIVFLTALPIDFEFGRDRKFGISTEPIKYGFGERRGCIIPAYPATLLIKIDLPLP